MDNVTIPAAKPRLRYDTILNANGMLFPGNLAAKDIEQLIRRKAEVRCWMVSDLGAV
jgi:hypothetical protein